MPDRNDIFVSYAHVDNEPMPGAETGWVTELTRGLRTKLTQRLGRTEDVKLWMDYKLKGNDTVTPEIFEQLGRSEIMLVVLSTAYKASGWCQKELKGFLGKHNIDEKRIFVVMPDDVDVPEEIKDLLSYRFYERTPEGKTIRYADPVPDPKQVAYYQLIDDLARDMAKRIKAIQGDGGETETIKLKPKGRAMRLLVYKEDPPQGVLLRRKWTLLFGGMARSRRICSTSARSFSFFS